MIADKYRPKKFSEIIGNLTLKDNLKKYKWKKPILMHGAPGVGKSIIAEVIASEFNFDIVKVTDENLDDVILTSQTSSIFGNKKLILVDNVDQIRDVKKVAVLVEKTKNPTILITSDFKSKRLRTLKRSCEKMQVRRPTTATVRKILEIICSREKIKISSGVLDKIAESANGDIRSAINDLETVAKGRERVTEKNLEILGKRDTKIDIYSALSKIFGAKDLSEVISCVYDLDEEPRNILLWIDENFPRIYAEKDAILKSTYYLSRADAFVGRITKRQYWGFLRYANPLMTAGVNVSKPSRLRYARYQFPMLIARLGHTKKERALKKSIGEKLSPFLHASTKTISQQYIPLFRTLLKKEKIKPDTLEKFKLNDEEIAYITGD